MKTEIIAVGSELLTPLFQDTNSLYLAQKFNDLGMEITYKSVVGDDWDPLTICLEQALGRADIVITIGGLGPTEDDRTKEAFASVLSRKLLFSQDLLKKIERRFKRRDLALPAVNKKQAYVLEGAEVLENENGTAPGQWLETGSNLILMLPGPPQEMKPMFDSSVYPRLKEFKAGNTARRILKVTGLTESKIETLIMGLHPKTPSLKLTTLAYPGQIEIHITGHSANSQEEADFLAEGLGRAIVERLGIHVFSTGGESLEEVVGKLLKKRKETLAVAESCTGGLLAHRLTNIPGSSDYFLEGIVAYSNLAKIQTLGVLQDLIRKHGAVSREVAVAMASGIREKAHADYGLAITGITGPAGGTAKKPVGLVFISLAWAKRVEAARNFFLGNRETIKFQSSQKALDLLRQHLLMKE